jgi:hypothetical protein
MKTSTRDFLKRHSLIVFLVLTLLISWMPWYTGGAGLFVFGPSLAGVIVIAVAYGKAGLRDLTQRTLRWRVGLVWWAIALFLPAFLTLISIGINAALGGKTPGFTFLRQDWFLAPVFFLMTIVGGPLGEESGAGLPCRNCRGGGGRWWPASFSERFGACGTFRSSCCPAACMR